MISVENMLFIYGLPARQRFTANAIMDGRKASAAEQGYRLTILCLADLQYHPTQHYFTCLCFWSS